MMDSFGLDREAAVLHDDLLPDADGRLLQLWSEVEIRVVPAAELGVVADCDFDDAGRKVVLEESRLDCGIESNPQCRQSVLSSRRLVPGWTHHCIVLLRGPGRPAILEGNADALDQRAEVRDGQVRDEDAFRGVFVRRHVRLTGRYTRHDVAIADVFRVDNPVVEGRVPPFEREREARTVRGADLHVRGTGQERGDLLAFPGNREEVNGARVDEHRPPSVQVESVRVRPLAARVAKGKPRPPQLRLLCASVPVRIVSGRGGGLREILPIPREIRRSREENVRVRLRERRPLRRGHVAELRRRKRLHGSPVRLLVLEERHRPRADGPQLVDELVGHVGSVVPRFDDHALVRPDAERLPDHVLRQGLVLGHRFSPGARTSPADKYMRPCAREGPYRAGPFAPERDGDILVGGGAANPPPRRGHPRAFARGLAGSGRLLLGWARSRLPVKRRGFQAVKRLVLFLTYAKALKEGRNPNWPALGYVAPGAAVERAWHRHPDDARVVPIRPSTELSLDADVCVVGSGAGGSLIAARLAAAGHRVVVLEAGAYRTADDFTQREAEAFDTMFQGHGLLTTRDLAFSVLAGQTAGGSATINWMTCLRPPMWAREEWERDHGMAGVTSAEFDGLLDDVRRRLRVTTAESVVNPSNEVLRRGCEALGYRAGADFDVIPRNARGCDTRCDFCFFGCVYNAKQSPLLTYLPDAFHAGARFLFDTKAERVAIEGGEARGVEATFRGDGREVPVHVRSRAVVAAGSAVQTPALLLRSGVRSPGIGRGPSRPLARERSGPSGPRGGRDAVVGRSSTQGRDAPPRPGGRHDRPRPGRRRRPRAR